MHFSIFLWPMLTTHTGHNTKNVVVEIEDVQLVVVIEEEEVRKTLDECSILEPDVELSVINTRQVASA